MITSKEGSYEDPVMSFCHGGGTISTKLWSIENTISPILHKCGAYHVDMFYYEESPLFHVVFSSESCVTKFLQEIQKVKSAMEVELHSALFRSMKFSHVHQKASQSFTVKVQPELFLVSPNRQERKGAEVHLVTADNCSTFVTRWKKSKLFDFGSLYQEEGMCTSTIVNRYNTELAILQNQQSCFSKVLDSCYSSATMSFSQKKKRQCWKGSH